MYPHEKSQIFKCGPMTRSIGRLEAENAELRRKAVDLVLQIQALRDGDQALTA